MFLIYFAPHKPAPGFTRGLPAVSKLLEFRLYKKSTCLEEYMDEDTLAERIVHELRTLRSRRRRQKSFRPHFEAL